MPNPNLDLLELVASRLRPVLSEIVFVGGCATGLLIDDPGAAPVRGTYDVDVIAEIASYAEYIVFSDRLRALGFREDRSEGAPVCRWKRIPSPEQFGSIQAGGRHFYRFGAVGSADTLCVIKGRHVGVEVKDPYGKQSEHQRAFQLALEALERRYILVYTLPGLVERVEELLANNSKL